MESKKNHFSNNKSIHKNMQKTNQKNSIYIKKTCFTYGFEYVIINKRQKI